VVGRTRSSLKLVVPLSVEPAHPLDRWSVASHGATHWQQRRDDERYVTSPVSPDSYCCPPRAGVFSCLSLSCGRSGSVQRQSIR